MRLRTMRLAGFKSFVDPTTLELPGNMTGVVGPNGCGKSNIIDAIRWVMGESAASRLRGDALTDVIFSGSSTRKPVGSAMVELLFDNSAGRAGGEYAGFNEISVKRIVSRDGQSQYFLNGVRCRRRDITDLFLGTGLGPRSYSIIEQGMISNIIESDPEQLRAHLEEAAGISLYKERRRETANRIKATRENLERVEDVRNEVDRQLEHLKRQARTAERWQAMKTELEQRRAALKGMELRATRERLAEHAARLARAGLGIEEQLAAQRRCEAAIETGRQEHAAAQEHMGTVQAEVYRIGAEVARIEQQIRHSRELTEQLERAHAEAVQGFGELGAHLESDTQRLQALQAELADTEPRLTALTEAATTAGATLQAAESAVSEWQLRWDRHTTASAAVARSAEVERTHLAHLDRQATEAAARAEALEREQAAIDLDALAAALSGLEGEHGALQARVDALNAELDSRRQTAEAALEAERSLQATLSRDRAELESLRGRLGSLEALQHAALGGNDESGHRWLHGLGLAGARRLGEALEVQGGWERAVETVLEGWLEAVLVPDCAALAGQLPESGEPGLVLMEATAGDPPAGTLAAHARGPAPALALLARVHTVASTAEGLRLLARLGSGESCITPAGEWLGPGFIRLPRQQGDEPGILAREREIRSLQSRQQALEAALGAGTGALATARDTRAAAEKAREEGQRELYLAQRRLAELGGQVQSQRGRLDGARERVGRIRDELTAVHERLAAAQEEARSVRGRLETITTEMASHEDQRRLLEDERRQLLQAREGARMDAATARDASHRMALALESTRAAAASLEQSLTRMQSQATQLAARRDELAARIAAGGEPVAELEAARESCLEQRVAVEHQLVAARQVLDERATHVRELEQERQATEQDITARREELAAMRLAEQEQRLHASALEDAITRAGFELAPLLASLPAEADAEAETRALEALEQRIRRLEPVNLAAIQEHEEQAQRKVWLDSQVEDLAAALETLEAAIRKIDRETRTRFRETFDRVNQGMQELFPRLFGGGHGHLELTGEDLLTTGVAIVARPPGKRVSSISLLSGGEKALTAVALVFSIFRLNPAPFCLLDEVDAPLDEANVGRFSALVSEMSEHVQFIFVTHNKATMEAASQLCGVTMREPGVSRLVQVDLAEASRLAGAA